MKRITLGLLATFLLTLLNLWLFGGHIAAHMREDVAAEPDALPDDAPPPWRKMRG